MSNDEKCCDACYPPRDGEPSIGGVCEKALKRWQKEAKESVKKFFDELKKKGVPFKDTTIGVPGPHGWCAQCDRDENHKHKIYLR